MLVVLLGMVALAIDVGRLVIAKQELQNVADAAALAGAARLRQGMDVGPATQAATDIGFANIVLGEPLTLDPDQDVQVGAWDSEIEQIVPWSPAFTVAAVGVTARRTQDSAEGPVPMIFAGLFGLESVDVTAWAGASMAVSNSPRSAVEIMVVQDASGSFEEEWADAIDSDWALMNLINGVSISGDNVGFVAFDDDIAYTEEWYEWRCRWWSEDVPLTLGLTPLSHEQGADLPADVQDTYDLASDHDANGYTNPAAGLNWAIDQYLADGNPNSQQSIVLVSDGMPFGPNPTITQQRRDDAIAAADRAEAEGIRIHTVTLTAEEYGDYGSGGADFEFNESLTRNGGYAFRTHDPAQLENILIMVGTIEIGHPHLFH